MCKAVEAPASTEGEFEARRRCQVPAEVDHRRSSFRCVPTSIWTISRTLGRPVVSHCLGLEEILFSVPIEPVWAAHEADRRE